jgi:hypothetical protein
MPESKLEEYISKLEEYMYVTVWPIRLGSTT